MGRRGTARTAGLVGALAATALLSGCGLLPEDPAKRPSTAPAPWVRGAESVVRMAAVGDRYIALRVTDDKGFELVSISGTTGRVEKRRAIDPLEEWDAENGYIRLTAAGGALAYDRETDTLDVLDPVTFEPRWSHKGHITDAADCAPHVCVTDAQDQTVVLDHKSGAELWTSDASVFTASRLIKVTEPDDSPHLRVSGVDPDTGKVRWSDQPTERFGDQVNGFGYRTVTADHAIVTAVDDEGLTVGFSMYDMTTGERLWSRTGLVASTMGGEVVGVAPDLRSLRYLDPETGEDRFTVRAPAGHTFFADGSTQAVDTAGKPWLALHRTGSTKVAFAPVDERQGTLGDVDASAATVVLSNAANAHTFQVVVDGETETVEAFSGFRVMSAGTGKPAEWSGDAPLPKAVKSVGDSHPFVLDADGFPVLERAG